MPRHFRGRLFNLSIAILISCSVMVVKSLFLGKYWRIRPLVFSLSPPACSRQALPGGIGVSEIKGCIERFGHGLMARKLPAVVRSQGMDIIRQGGKLLQDGGLDRIRLLAGDLGNQRQARLTFGQGHEGLFVALANDCIQFPITQSGTPVDDGRSFINGNAARPLATAAKVTVALPAPLLATQATVQVAALLFVPQNIAINPLTCLQQAGG